MHETISQPPDASRPPFDAEAFAQATTDKEKMDASWEAALERRIIALEQIAAAPGWLIRTAARRRLRAELRRDDADFAWVGGDFAARRIEATSTRWLSR